MNTKHARGPWRRKEWATRDSDGAIETCGWQVVDADGHLVIACCVEGASDEEEAALDLIAAAPELLEACITFAEWMRREKEGFVNADNERDTPEGEARWRAWYSENLRLCDLAQEQALAAVAKATGASHVHDQ